MDPIDITPLQVLKVDSSLESTIHFQTVHSVKDIVSTVYHLVLNRDLLLQNKHLELLIGNINRLTFNIDHPNSYPALQDRLHNLQHIMGGGVSLSSTLKSTDSVEVAIDPVTPFYKPLYLLLALELKPFIAKVNDIPALMKKQSGALAELYRTSLDPVKGKGPEYCPVVAYGTNAKTFPAIAFKLATSDKNSEIGWLMAKIPVGVVVRIYVDAGNIDNSTVSLWAYDKYKRQGRCIQQTEPLSTPGGRISLWASDFLTADDATLPDGYRRPCQVQKEAHEKPNVAIDYAKISEVLKAVADQCADDHRPEGPGSTAGGARSILSTRAFCAAASDGNPARWFSTHARAAGHQTGSHTLAAARGGGGAGGGAGRALPVRAAGSAAGLGRALRSLGRLVRK